MKTDTIQFKPMLRGGIFGGTLKNENSQIKHT